MLPPTDKDKIKSITKNLLIFFFENSKITFLFIITRLISFCKPSIFKLTIFEYIATYRRNFKYYKKLAFLFLKIQNNFFIITRLFSISKLIKIFFLFNNLLFKNWIRQNQKPNTIITFSSILKYWVRYQIIYCITHPT